MSMDAHTKKALEAVYDLHITAIVHLARILGKENPLKVGGKMTAEDVIMRYYALKSEGARVTIKQLSEDYGFSENYLYQAKALYDKAVSQEEQPS